MSGPVLDRSYTLVVPGLLDLSMTEHEPAVTQVGRLPELEYFFSRAQKQGFSGTGLDATMFALFDVDVPSDADLPVAAVAYVGETGESESAWYLCVDPVQLIPDRDQLVLMGPESLSLSQVEADQLVADLNAQFSQDGWHIEACTPTRWYLRSVNEPKLRTYPLAQVRGQSISNYMPKGNDGKQWHRLMNEMQMVLHSSDVNRQRQIIGKPPVSSLWFWGGGNIPEIQYSRWSNLCSNEPVSLGMAALSGTRKMCLPKDATAWLAACGSSDENLLVLDTLSRYVQDGETEAWIQQIRELEQAWFMPLIEAIRSKQISALTLCACNGSKYTLSRSGLRRWWCGKKSFATIIMQEGV